LARRRRRQRQHRDRAQFLFEALQLAVRRPEVVAPVADAMRLVDDDERDRAPGDDVAKRSLERLGRQVDQLELAAAQLTETRLPLFPLERRVDERGAKSQTHERIDLILHERDERRQDEHCSRQDLGWNLKSDRLAGAGRHDPDAIAAAQHGVDEMPLARTEFAIAEDTFQDLLRVERRPRGVPNHRFEQRPSAPWSRGWGRPIVRTRSKPVHTSLELRAGPPAREWNWYELRSRTNGRRATARISSRLAPLNCGLASPRALEFGGPSAGFERVA